MESDELVRIVLDHVGRPGYQPVKPKVIARELGLSDDDARLLKKTIKKLVRQGKLDYGSGHQVMLPGSSSSDRVTGEFRRMSGGYGFVRPSATPRALGKKQDIYISAKNAGDASTGDIVLVRLSKKQTRGDKNVEGQILEVIERETHKFVGTYFERAGRGLAQIDGKVFSEPVYVGDPGAKGANVDDKVVIEMVRFPTHFRDGEGVIVEVLGPRGDPGIDTLSIIHEFGLPGDFAEDAIDNARAQADKFDESLGDDRTDFTKSTIITIDPVDARDFDDAISLERLANGHWQLGVHIADVSHFVREKSPLDREAEDRATSVYLPDRVIPMIPEIISNNLASLQPNRVRYAMTAIIEMTPEGARVATELHQSAICSQRRFTYEEVDEYLADREAWKEKLEPEVHSLLGRMHELAMILRNRRFERGSLELTMPEVKIDLDRNGRVTGAHLVEHTESHQIIEEFMLAANEAVATLLKEQGILFMRRIHESPDPRKLKQLTEFARELGFSCESLESRFEIQRLLDEVKDTRQQHAVNYAVLRSMQKAIYSPESEGHFALASDCYCHFTSPIRRYPDLTVHRLIKALLREKLPHEDFGALAAQAEHCSQREQRAEQAERELTKVKLLNYLSTRIGMEMTGIITGVEEFGLFVQGVEMPAEGLVHISALQDDYYHYDRPSHSLTGRRSNNAYQLGDAVRVVVQNVDVDRRELDFRITGRAASLPKLKTAKEKQKASLADGKSGKKPKRKKAKRKKQTDKAQERPKKPKKKLPRKKVPQKGKRKKRK